MKNSALNRVIPFRYQLAVNDCAPACVMAIAEYFALPVSLVELRKKLVTDPVKGTTLRNFDGLRAWFSVGVGRYNRHYPMDEQLMPFIAFWPGQAHFVVVWSMTHTTVTIGDPGIGVIQMALSAFLQNWDGITIILRPLAPSPNRTTIPTRSPYRVIRNLLRGQVALLISLAIPATFLGVLNATFSIIFPYYLPHIHRLLLLTSIFLILSLSLSSLTAWGVAALTRRLNREIVALLLPAFRRLDAQFYTVGDAYTRFHDVQAVVDVMVAMSRDVPYATIIWLGTVGYLGYRRPLMDGIMLGLILMIWILLSPFVRRVRNYFYQLRLKTTRLNNELNRGWGGSLSSIFEPWMDLVHLTYRQSLWGIPITVLVQQTAVLGILVIAGLVGLQKRPTPPASLLSLVFLVGYLTTAAHALYQKYVNWQTAQPSLFRLQDFLDLAE